MREQALQKGPHILSEGLLDDRGKLLTPPTDRAHATRISVSHLVPLLEFNQTPWDDLHVTYFNSYALWTYLTIPFLYTYPGFITEELEPWHEDGEIWRTLCATFPEGIASHTRQQILYFGPDGLLRRHEYMVDVLGGARGVNYAHDYREVDGISVPMKRRVYSYDADKRKIPEPVLVAIDVHAIAFN